jgi:hypothetical protein
MLIHNAAGNFSFISGIAPFSFGCVADKGYEIVHASLHPLPELWEGLDLVERHITALGRPLNALCGIELRVPQAFSPEGFARFNRPYQEKLAQWKLGVNGRNPVARTNVAEQAAPVTEPSVYGFSYTIPSTHPDPTFILAGAPEARLTESGFEIVAEGDTSTDGLRRKLEFILETTSGWLGELARGWDDATRLNLYTIHHIHPLIESTIAPATKTAPRNGLCWYYARPPVDRFDLELDARGVRQEQILRP